jgi:excisionase family DNA binding protein
MKTSTLSPKQKNEEQKSILQLNTIAKRLKGKYVQLKINNEEQTIKIPISSFKEMMKIFLASSQKQVFVSTSRAAAILDCSRPHVVSLLENGKIPFIKVGSHRRILEKDIYNYKNELKQMRKSVLTNMIIEDEELGVYAFKE